MTQNEPYALIFPEPEYIDAPEDNQHQQVEAQHMYYQFGSFLEVIDLFINQDGTIQLRFEGLPELYHLIKNDNSELNYLSRKLKKIQNENDVRALRYEIIDKLFSRPFQVHLKRNLALSLAHSLFKTKYPSTAEFYRRVLSVYMLNTHLPKLLNRFLKGENFNPEDGFLPIFLCVCHAFLYKTLDQADGVNNFYEEVEDDEGNYCIGKKIQLKEFWVMKTGKPDFSSLLGKDDQIYSGGSYYKLMKPIRIKYSFDHTKSLKTYLHIEVPKGISKDYSYSVYIKLDQERVLFGKETNQAVFAPGCYFIVMELTEIPAKKIETESSQEENENSGQKIRIIKLKMVAQDEEHEVVDYKKKKEDEESIVEELETRIAEPEPSFWNPDNYDDYWNLNSE
jgi:hypothetical protein